MKMGNTILKTTTVAFVLTMVIMMNACKKDSNSSNTGTNNNNASTLTGNGATSDNAYDDIFNVGLQTSTDASLNSIIERGGGTTTLSLGTTTNGINSYYCAAVNVVTGSGSSFPVTITVDFGSGCTSQDQITRSGLITYVFTGRLTTPGTVITATFTNYKVNGFQIGGTYTITNTSPSASSLSSLTTSVTNGTVLYPNDSSYTFTGAKTINVIPGVNIGSTVLNITGGYTIGNAHTGEALTVAVVTPLVRNFVCPFIVSGTASFVYTKGTFSLDGTLDYGTGNCDANAVITIGAFTKTITL
jgi:hypothetical protein